MAKRRSLQLDGLRLQGCDLASIARGEVRLVLTPGARREVRRSRGVVELIASRGVSVYGIKTGFGRFCDVPVPAGDMRALQVNLVRSHGAGVGEPLGDDVVRLALALRANALARGRSGIRLETLELLISLYNEDVLPWIPSQGSVGASGDLAPLAHLAQVLIGEGRARVGGRWMSGRAALRKCGLSPGRLEAKEGLSLITGVQVSRACLATALLLADTLLEAADVIGAITLDALLCSLVPFHRKIHDARPHPGQRVVARHLRH
ncbi:MAG: aromatic amino acid lyase, partial [Planctomycetota bacterium]